MLASLITAAFLFAVPDAPATGLAAPCLQGDLDEQIKEFKAIIKGREHVAEAISLIDQLVQHYQADSQRLALVEESLELKEGNARELKSEKKAIQKQQKAIAKTVALAFGRKQVTEPHMQLWKAAAYAFGFMGADGAANLWRVFKDKRFSRDVEYRALLVRQVGQTKDYRQGDMLTDTLDYHEEIVAAAAAEALVLFNRAPAKMRRDMVARLVVLLESRHNAATDYSDTTARRIYSTVRKPYIDALSSLTRQTFGDPLDWTKWWNQNKKNAAAWPEYD